MQRILNSTLAGLGAALLVACLTGSAAAQDVSVGGLVYAQYAYQLKDTTNHANSFDITRAYINVVGKFKGGLLTRVTPDVYRAADGSAALRLKYAYVQYTPGGGNVSIKFGQTQTPWLDWAEGVWGYRMQGTMAPERNGYVTSSDLGLAVDGDWGKGLVDAQAGVYNGEGYHGGVGDQRKDVMGRISVRVLPSDVAGSRGGLRLTAYGSYGKPTGGGRRTRLIGMASYKTTLVTLAVEGLIAQDTSTTAPSPEVTGRVLSGWGVFNIPNSRAAIVARVDVADPNKDVANDGNTRYIAGLSYRLHQHLLLLADLDYLHYQGTPTPAQEANRAQGLFQMEFTF
jgi:hypothetical protein